MAALLAFGPAPTARGASPGPAATPPPRPLNIDKNSALILIRTTLVALQQANQTGSYNVLYGISAPGFQSVNPPERLSEIFANLRAKNFDLSGVVVIEPQLTILPEIFSNGVMRMAGFFPSVPLQVYFELQFTPVQGQWRLLAISVDVGPATAPAPVTANPPAPAGKASAQSASAEVRIFPKASAAAASPEKP